MIKYPVNLNMFEILAREYICANGVPKSKIKEAILKLFYLVIREFVDKQKTHFKCLPGGLGVFLPSSPTEDFYTFKVRGVEFEMTYHSAIEPYIMIITWGGEYKSFLDAETEIEIHRICSNFSKITHTDLLIALSLEDSLQTVHPAPLVIDRCDKIK